MAFLKFSSNGSLKQFSFNQLSLFSAYLKQFSSSYSIFDTRILAENGLHSNSKLLAENGLHSNSKFDVSL